MVSYDAFMVTLSTVLGASLLVERILEFLKNILETRIGTRYRRMTPGFQEIDRKIDDLEKLSRTSREDGEWEERYPLNTVLVEPATDPDDGTLARACIIQIMGFALGIFTAHFFGVRLFKTLVGGSQSIAGWVDYLLTGLLIGGGSGPIHVLIRFVTQRKISAPAGGEANSSEEKEAEPTVESGETGKPAAVVQSPGASVDELDIPYYGGVDREILEGIHMRKEDPGLIVYHHTAMNHSSTFEDVVRVIKNRGWVTGYNCVIMADGAVKPFCRWDRYGSHAKGYNMKSLGIAFNGNFETDPKVPNSNPDGRYGPSRPTEAQVKAGARVVTLWTFLYNIAPDFENAIIPHSKIADKACPGSNFPCDEFREWVKHYQERWQKSAEMKERIKAFKLKPYLYVKQ
jgi:N-acetylmuramoyl-L-alanine amidase